ncbi:hypothetical protein P9112_014270 [Eukaryota sp. TZLM1-RC]
MTASPSQKQPKSILKHSSPSPHAESKSGVQFDQHNLQHNEDILEQLAEEFGDERRFIDEPKTPYRYSSDSEEMSSSPESTPLPLAEGVQQAFDTGAFAPPTSSATQGDFNQKRKAHYGSIGSLLKR